MNAPKLLRRFWTSSEDERLRALYPHVSTKSLAPILTRSERAIYGRAKILGILKSAEYLASPEACRLRRGDQVGEAYRFKPGHTPLNKGLRRPGWAPGRMASTQFKKGEKPKNNTQPVGAEVVDTDGYLKVKISDCAPNGFSRRDWKFKHVLVWEALNGPLPTGYIVIFRDRDRSNLDPVNLEAITKADNMRRNTIHRYPPEVKDVIRLAKKLHRTIEAKHEEQDSRSA